MSAAVTV